ncbi:hypothetical protein F2P56_002496 [Juglans regia]|uniref:Uncharacterized protein LOC109009866 n=2 Tax=Juglans regia TaxID=51240 RepID=A0A2I4GQ89_JUGRE|nr:uncharacterized protein LOC109009866 [Juglans regia]KAF5481883.1 hypothetical protein F2P56_002496 [Juglans regia]
MGFSNAKRCVLHLSLLDLSPKNSLCSLYYDSFLPNLSSSSFLFRARSSSFFSRARSFFISSSPFVFVYELVSLPLLDLSPNPKPNAAVRCRRRFAIQISTKQRHPRVKLPYGAKKIVPSGCRAMIGQVAGGGRTHEKSLLKTGNAYHKFRVEKLLAQGTWCGNEPSRASSWRR